MKKSELVSKFGRDDDAKIVLSRILDLCERCETQNVLTSSGFLTSGERAAAEDMLRYDGRNNVFFFGGYREAERVCAVFLPEYVEREQLYETPSLAEIEFIEAKTDKFDAESAAFTHRDVLGSLMALGIERRVVGDIYASGGTTVFAVRSSIAEHIASSLDRIGRYSVKASLCPAERMKSSVTFEEGRGSVSSLRLDGVLAEIFGLSRSAAAEAVRGGGVTLNSRETGKPDADIKDGDVIACRGKGKAVFITTDGESRKGKIRIVFKKYR